jgi:hypothetical protein
MVVHTFNPITWKAEAGRLLSLRPAYSPKCAQDSQGYTEKPCLEKTKKQNKKKKKHNNNKTFRILQEQLQ